MKLQNSHEMLTRPLSDEAARQDFTMQFRKHISTNISPANFFAYHVEAESKYKKEHNRKPENRHEVADAMEANPYYQMYSVMQRACQEITWESVIDSVERELPDLIARAKNIGNASKGSLTLHADFEVPKYLTAYDIHLQPGSYHAILCEDDVAAGAIYDRGAYLYSIGNWGPDIDHLARTVSKYYRGEFADKTPRRILEIGCSVGNSTVAWAEMYPDAEVHGIDVGESMLRYAHARAEAKGYGVHFSQQNAECTDFDDGYFDLIVTHLVMHETSNKAVHNIYKECYRLLSPGGVMIHQDIPMFKGMEPLPAFLSAWEVKNVNEFFAETYRSMDVVDEAIKAGFDPDKASLAAIKHFKEPEVTNYNTSQARIPALVGIK
jgi:ubiquinone/menaquinone biosynthesis C-methylase UbiE